MNKNIITQFLDECFDSISKYILKTFIEDIKVGEIRESNSSYVLFGKIDWDSERYDDIIKIVKNNMHKLGIKKLLIYSNDDNDYQPINDLFLKNITNIFITDKGYMIANLPNLFSFIDNLGGHVQRILITRDNSIKLSGATINKKKSFMKHGISRLFTSTSYTFSDKQKCSFVLEIEDIYNDSFVFTVVLDRKIKEDLDEDIYSTKINKDFIINSLENLENFLNITFKVKKINSLNSLLSFPVLKDVKSKLYDSNKLYNNNENYNKKSRELKINYYKNIIADLKKYINKNVNLNGFNINSILSNEFNYTQNKLKIVISLENIRERNKERIATIEFSTRCINYNNKSKMKIILQGESLEYTYVIKIGEIIKYIGEYFDNQYFSKIIDEYKKQKKSLDNIKNEKIHDFFKSFYEKKNLEYLIVKSKFNEFDNIHIRKDWEVKIDD